MEFLIGIVILMLIIGIHEFGHFAAFRFFGGKVEEFAIGFGPKIMGVKIKETQYNLRLLFPLGGFVKANEEDYKNFSLLQKSIYILAGIFLNLLSFVIASGLLSKHGFFYGVYRSTTAIPMFIYNLLSSIQIDQLFSKQASIENQITAMNDMVNSSTPLEYFAILSLLIAIFNMIPIPVLDGGRFILIFLEALLVKLKVENVKVEKINGIILFIGGLIITAMIYVPNFLSAAEDFHMSPFLFLLWNLLLITLIGNIIIFVRNRKMQKNL
ncbi:membrane-associated protease RseP (regulator of RpoE activity) [Paenibacillus sp. V4I9]|uniref:site-2 protease family protein n=1 Tax=Paenibacillus sp. V4I9 TaxID=3042308 RepID=UPI0027880548|nr:site-2 protease family protein [Paenibacillus sp. V4I9]MDQ0888908.1 membrane-associated protease RseP (regulator of RpoE activity) [Paenibacillus sp. V4I9]